MSASFSYVVCSFCLILQLRLVCLFHGNSQMRLLSFFLVSEPRENFIHSYFFLVSSIFFFSFSEIALSLLSSNGSGNNNGSDSSNSNYLQLQRWQQRQQQLSLQRRQHSLLRERVRTVFFAYKNLQQICNYLIQKSPCFTHACIEIRTNNHLSRLWPNYVIL